MKRYEDIAPDLKPCRFCGGKGVFLVDIRGLRVQCSGCGVQTKPEVDNEKLGVRDVVFIVAKNWNDGNIV